MRRALHVGVLSLPGVAVEGKMRFLALFKRTATSVDADTDEVPRKRHKTSDTSALMDTADGPSLTIIQQPSKIDTSASRNTASGLSPEEQETPRSAEPPLKRGQEFCDAETGVVMRGRADAEEESGWKEANFHRLFPPVTNVRLVESFVVKGEHLFFEWRRASADSQEVALLALEEKVFPLGSGAPDLDTVLNFMVTHRDESATSDEFTVNFASLFGQSRDARLQRMAPALSDAGGNDERDAQRFVAKAIWRRLVYPRLMSAYYVADIAEPLPGQSEGPSKYERDYRALVREGAQKVGVGKKKLSKPQRVTPENAASLDPNLSSLLMRAPQQKRNPLQQVTEFRWETLENGTASTKVSEALNWFATSPPEQVKLFGTKPPTEEAKAKLCAEHSASLGVATSALCKLSTSELTYFVALSQSCRGNFKMQDVNLRTLFNRVLAGSPSADDDGENNAMAFKL